MPTPAQVKAAYDAVKAVCPNARIKSVGPEGVTFEYPDGTIDNGKWDKEPFAA
jgi:hypothetical protein